MKILIIANARIKGGLSGGDNIYLHFAKYWPGEIDVWELMDIDFVPFWLCYGVKIFFGILKAAFCRERYQIVYSASDFWMDSIPGFIMKLKGHMWIAGFYLYAPPGKKIYWLMQQPIKWLIRWFSDMVFVTNDSMNKGWRNKKVISVHGGVDLHKAGLSPRHRKYDAVFVGRIHETKGINELMQIWRVVVDYKPNAKLVIIGDGDLGLDYLCNSIKMLGLQKNIDLMGYMGPERFSVYKESKMVLYPTPPKYSHFSMAPVEAMACGCPLVTFHTPAMCIIKPEGAIFAESNIELAKHIVRFIEYEKFDESPYVDLQMRAYKWAQQWDWEKRAKTVYEGVYHEFRKR